MEHGEHLAAIDLGSNSFHMVVARQAQGEIQILDGLSEKVQLGAGLDRENRLDADTQERALECLGRFAQRIAGIPRGSVRVVGTNTLRQARNAREFIRRAEAVLGHDIEVVAGREEARLIYLGVAHTLADDAGQRLVVDIGGGSTELIIGERFESTETESLHMGCVSFAQRFFPNGEITEKAFDRAVTAARQEVLSIHANYRRLGWQQAVGASGTIKAISQVCVDNGWSEFGITLDGMKKVRKRVIKAGAVDKLDLKGLREDRQPIFASGLAILYGIFEQLGIDQMEVSSGALREGLLYDLLGRFGHEDVRDRSIQALMNRHHVESSQAERVCATALALYQQVASDWQIEGDEAADTLRWGGLLHEVGLAVSHSQFHKHGAYLVTNSDLPGFSRQEQQMVALMVRGHRRKVPLAALAELPDDEQTGLLRLCLVLRLAVRLHHARSDEDVPEIRLQARGERLAITFPPGWLEEHPLTQADLEQEHDYFQAAGYQLVLA
ncbi:exopolyphosphatase [Alcanivorax sp. VBW004]|jgi:exopolyphosphatase/guanosine-5'-triphosphate,3'-diphosphate pyrophosphatase|uniref:exopolyphosphatase n=1 Tax=unclassified Alcanivorax TaxID=2638842 RepID=UPI0012BD2C5A|nr:MULTISPECIES: exopolyphosphatase [unclassified Alcanivorax]MTT52108.1 exopolyphosphatase [Alcanivorax sp. VBW004]HIL22348.1 exopolyphosphatase [Alcanivorax sp.]